MKPDGMKDHIYQRYQSDGFTEEDIQRIWQETLYFRARLAENRPEREVTCTNYENAQKRMEKEVSGWLTGRGKRNGL